MQDDEVSVRRIVPNSFVISFRYGVIKELYPLQYSASIWIAYFVVFVIPTSILCMKMYMVSLLWVFR